MNNEISNQGTTDAAQGTEIEASEQYPQTEVTTMTTTTTEAAVPAKISKLYPFETKAQIAAKIASSDEYMLGGLCQLHTWQTEHEQEVRTTEEKNRRGFMSSHAVNGSKLAEKVKGGEALTGEEMAKARSIVCRYTRQLAVASREASLDANPELRATAAIFGV